MAGAVGLAGCTGTQERGQKTGTGPKYLEDTDTVRIFLDCEGGVVLYAFTETGGRGGVAAVPIDQTKYSC